MLLLIKIKYIESHNIYIFLVPRLYRPDMGSFGIVMILQKDWSFTSRSGGLIVLIQLDLPTEGFHYQHKGVLITVYSLPPAANKSLNNIIPEHAVGFVIYEYITLL